MSPVVPRRPGGVEAPSPLSRQRVAVAFGGVLRARREVAGLSQERFAQLAGMDRTTPSLYERGLRQPTLAYVFVIAAVLGIEAERLVTETRARLQGVRP